MLSKRRAVLQNFADATQHEWIETNGLGGWAGSSIIGANTRRYHGLLTAAINPPAERMVLLSKLDETIVTGMKRTELGVNLYAGNTIHPNGHHYLCSFKKELFPEWLYQVGGIELRKRVAMIHDENTVLVLYDVLKADQPFELELLPLVAARGYHSLRHAGPEMHWDVEFDGHVFHNRPDGKNDIYISIPGAVYKHDPRWFNSFEYKLEKYRGLDHNEDLFNHGVFTVALQQGDSLGVIVSTTEPLGRNAQDLFGKEKLRRMSLFEGQPGNELLQQLLLAADQFIVKRDEDLKTVIAGYHWFTDWGRDTMISLPGLCLATARFDDAKKIISAFGKSVSEGMLPNRFQDNGEAPEYNNVDGTLWYFIAVHKYLEATGDKEFVLSEILPVLKSIVEWHHKGTRYGIHVDEDGLLYSGEDGVQLTWMDAKVDDWVVTPRTGKAVEIQALWFNALNIYAGLLRMNGETASHIDQQILLIRQNFLIKFRNPGTGYLFDVIDNDKPDATLRPNQLFAISLPFALLDDNQSQSVLNAVTEKLYTRVGLRSLPADDPRYIGVYGGDAMHRDAAYHQGTVWSWLLGPYIDAIMRSDQEDGKEKAKKIIDEFSCHLNEAGIGTISEIFDGDAPHQPRGCVAQAWSVAEMLRVIWEYRLLD